MRELSFNDHGGECCGVIHLYDFPTFAGDFRNAEKAEEILRNDIQEAIGMCRRSERSKRCILIEVILTEGQLKLFDGLYKRLLDEFGFKQGPVWVNSNTGHILYMFHWYIPIKK